MSIENILNIASTGIMAQRVAIEVTSENIANVNTPGYSRQRVVMQSSLPISTGGFGGGVLVEGVQRSYDGLLQQQIVSGSSDYANSLARQSALQEVEPLFNELTGSGLGQAMDDFFNSWQDLTLNPQGSPERQALLTSSQLMVDRFRQLNASLVRIQSAADSSLSGIVDFINDKAESIARLNGQILQAEQLGVNANELKDNRDYLLQQLGEKVGISFSQQTDGTVAVSLPGGEPLVAGIQYASLSIVSVATTGSNLPNPANSIHVTAIGNPPPAPQGTDADITQSVGGADNSKGEMGAALYVRDLLIKGYLDKLDAMAKTMVTEVNAKHNLGYGLDGSSGDFFDPAGITSASIALSTGFSAAKIAAAGPLPAPAGVDPGNNVNALAMADLKTKVVDFVVGGVTSSTQFGTFQNIFVSGVGSDLQSAKNTQQQDDGYLRQLKLMRESISGVSIDEEMTNLIKYQRGFEASARLVSVAGEMYDAVLAMLR